MKQNTRETKCAWWLFRFLKKAVFRWIPAYKDNNNNNNNDDDDYDYDDDDRPDNYFLHVWYAICFSGVRLKNQTKIHHKKHIK